MANSEREQLEQKLRESEERFRLVADTAPVLMWMSGPDRLCTYFNKPWLEFTGRSYEQELGYGWVEGVHSEDLQRCLDTYTQSFDRQEKFKMEYRLRRHDGEYRWVFDVGVPRFNQERSLMGYIGICVDVTERKRTEEALQDRERKLIEAQRLAGVGSWQWDLRTDTLIWSKELYHLMGIDPTLPAPSYKEQAHLFAAESSERLQRAVQRALQTGTSYQLELEVVRPESIAKWGIARGEPVRDKSGEIIGLRGTVQDITEHKRAEKALSDMTRKLVEAQEQERTRIAREIHDDITQRLAMLAIEIEQLQEHPETPSEVRDRADRLSKRTKEISTDLQALSHELHSPKLEYLGIVGGMKNWCSEFGERQGMEIEFKSSGLPPLPSETSLCLFRVLQEALHNAAKYSGAKRVEVQIQKKSWEIHLIVSDLGKGFDVVSAMQGRGLGVTSMQERVRLVGGTILIDSKPLGGTTIHVRVPLGADRSFRRVAG
jgi:PAS domain S-box-containing protein